eukprot:5418554-Amphidinium_carterae.1
MAERKTCSNVALPGFRMDFSITCLRCVAFRVVRSMISAQHGWCRLRECSTAALHLDGNGSNQS